MKMKWKFVSILPLLILTAVMLVMFAPQGGFAALQESTGVELSAAANDHKITTAEAKQRMNKNPNIVIVDVRRQAEYDAGHIQGAILIPLETLTDSRPELLNNQNAEIFVYCRTGKRSKQAAEKLASLGYTDVYDIGGIQDWPYEVVKEVL